MEIGSKEYAQHILDSMWTPMGFDGLLECNAKGMWRVVHRDHREYEDWSAPITLSSDILRRVQGMWVNKTMREIK